MGCFHAFDNPGRDSCVGLLQGVDEINTRNVLNFLLLISLYLVYVLTFYRFYVGNIRVFDMRYIEVVKFIGLLGEKQTSAVEKDSEYRTFFEYIDGNSRWESIYLIFKTLVIISLTIEINTPRNFMIIYLLLMVMDIVWIALTSPPTPYFRELFFKTLGLNEDAGLGMNFPSRATELWKRNNIWCAFWLGLVLLCVYSRECVPLLQMLAGTWFYLAAGAAVMLFNCLQDLHRTWRFYNPRFADVYARFPPSRDDGAPAEQKAAP